jgi:hypothetical protein
MPPMLVNCVWIDSSGTLDPQSASAAGIQLSSLLWVNCRGHAEHALKATDLLLHGGGFGLMVFDMADIPESVARRIPVASWSPATRGRGNRDCPYRAYLPATNAIVFDIVR